MSKARITYRFGREPQNSAAEETTVQPVQRLEEPPPGKVIPLYQEDFGFGNQDYGAWKSSFGEETDRIEKLIRGSEAESRHGTVRDTVNRKPLYYTAEDAEESFERIPFYDDHPRPVYRRARKHTNWFGMTTSVAGAVLTGVLLGMFVLSMFRGESAPASDTAGNADLPGIGTETEAETETDSTIGSADDITGQTQNGQSVTVAASDTLLPERTYYLVQNGVFSSSEGAELAASELKEKGLAGAVESGDKLSVFAGVAEDRDDALLIGHHLQNEGLEVYVKSYVLPAAAGLNGVGSEGYRQYLEMSRELVGNIIAVSLQHLNESSPAALSAEQLAQLKSDHRQWTEIANTVTSEAPESAKALLQGMHTSIHSAMANIEQYQKKPSNAYMWQVQTAVTEHLIKQKQFLEQN